MFISALIASLELNLFPPSHFLKFGDIYIHGILLQATTRVCTLALSWRNSTSSSANADVHSSNRYWSSFINWPIIVLPFWIFTECFTTWPYSAPIRPKKLSLFNWYVCVVVSPCFEHSCETAQNLIRIAVDQSIRHLRICHTITFDVIMVSMMSRTFTLPTVSTILRIFSIVSCVVTSIGCSERSVTFVLKWQ